MKKDITEYIVILILTILVIAFGFYLGVFFTKVDAVKHKMGYWKVDNYANVTFAWSTNLLTPEVLK